MDQTTLVGPDLSAGHEALALLDAAQVKHIVALFMLSPEYGDWKFVVSSPSLDQTSSLKAHEQVHKIWRGRFIDSLPLMIVLRTKDPFIRDLRKLLHNVRPGAHYLRIGGQTIGNRFVSEGIVIRLPGIID
jgi:hypothetical protein